MKNHDQLAWEHCDLNCLWSPFSYSWPHGKLYPQAWYCDNITSLCITNMLPPIDNRHHLGSSTCPSPSPLDSIKAVITLGTFRFPSAAPGVHRKIWTDLHYTWRSLLSWMGSTEKWRHKQHSNLPLFTVSCICHNIIRPLEVSSQTVHHRRR